MKPLVIITLILGSQLHAADAPAKADKAAPRPNIIFLLTDDQRDNTLGAMGHPFVKTPHLDALMQDSVRFKNTYIATPVCSPSRVSYFTGMPERVHGVGFSSSYDLTEQQWERTYPALLHKGNYLTGFVGKFGVEYYTFKGKAAEKFDFWWGHDGWTKFLPNDRDTPSTTPYHHAKSDIITPIMGETMTKFVDTSPKEKPFCLSVSFNVPHGSQVTSMFTDYPEWNLMKRPSNENLKLKGSPFYDGIPPERYGAELEKLVMELKKTGRPLVWASTTPVKNGSKPDDAEAYNAVALQVMHKHQIPVNDLYRFVRQSQLPMQGCHFPREASERIGNQVAGKLLGSISQSAPSERLSKGTAK
jgi:hypothetical protein